MLPDDVTHLVREIRNIRKARQTQDSIDQINKEKVSKLFNSIPDQDPDRHDKDDLGYAEIKYNKLCHTPPSDNPYIQTRRDSPQSPTRPASPGTPSAPSPSRVPSASAARNVSLASSNTVEDREESPSDGRKASGSPDSPDEIKPSSRR